MNPIAPFVEKRQKPPEEGQKELLESAKTWSTGLGTLSVQAAYAIIAANWAVHRIPDTILTNRFATWSIGICIGFISINILLTGITTELLRSRWQKAEDTPDWWKSECERQAETKWPFTDSIEALGFGLRMLKIIAPILAGLFFLISLTPVG